MTDLPTTCPECGQPVAAFASDSGIAAACIDCGLVYMTREQIEEMARGPRVTRMDVVRAYGLGKTTVYEAVTQGWIDCKRDGDKVELWLSDVEERWGEWPQEEALP